MNVYEFEIKSLHYIDMGFPFQLFPKARGNSAPQGVYKSGLREAA